MPESVVRFEPASALSPAELTALWNRAYEDYFVPLVFTEAHLSHHLRRSGVDLSRSLVGRVDGEAFGLSIVAMREERAWLGGFGVTVARRRQGLASRMLAEHLMRLDLARIAETSLEVISQNPAREIYRQAGFAERGARLLVIGGVPEPKSEEVGVTLDPDALLAAHGALVHAEPLTWRRQPQTLVDDLAHGAGAIAVMRGGAPAAFAVLQDIGKQTTLLDAAAADAGSARALLDALARRRPGATVRIVDEPETSHLAQAMLEAGFEFPLTQVEMMRPRA